MRRTGAAVYIANNYLQHSIDINTFNYYYIYLLIRIVSLHIALIDFIVEILDIFRELIKTFGLHEHWTKTKLKFFLRSAAAHLYWMELQRMFVVHGVAHANVYES